MGHRLTVGTAAKITRQKIADGQHAKNNSKTAKTLNIY